jgi:predicted dithiol-disulfide oxidoreductase (DUF899 family)
MENIKQFEQEVNRCELLLAECDSEIIRLEGLIAHLEQGGGSHIYDTAPPPVFEASEYKIKQREKYSPEIYQKSGQNFLEDFKLRLSEQQQKLPKLEGNYQNAVAAYQKALNAQSEKI